MWEKRGGKRGAVFQTGILITFFCNVSFLAFFKNYFFEFVFFAVLLTAFAL
jgi:hypothetical protein